MPHANPSVDELTTGAEEVRWNLNDLYSDARALLSDMERADQEAAGFAAEFRGRMEICDASELREALQRYEAIHDRLGRAFTYAQLNWATDTADPERGALLQRVREGYTRTNQRLLFLELDWAHLPDERAQALTEAPELEAYRHYLELIRLRQDHLLSEPEEKILSEKHVTGRAAWNRFFDETLASARFSFRGESLTQQRVLAKLYEPDREVRREAALGFTEGLTSHVRALTFVFNTILADKASNDRLRGYPTWLSSRNLDNEVADLNVEALIEAVTGGYELVARFYRLKRRLLGLDEMFDYDRYAPVGEVDRKVGWEEARTMVLEAYEGFHPRMGAIASEFFEKRWIDAALGENKRGGAFSHGSVPSAHPYILMNYTGRIRDVQTLAHELGHGVHQYLSRGQGLLLSDTPLTTAETASVFGEMLVFQRLMAEEPDPANRLAMLVSKIDDTIATVFRQVAMNRFEDRIHTARRTAGELSPEAFSEHWMATQEAMFRGSVTLGDHYRLWWSYIPHFLHTPGYVYAYAFGELLVLALYRRYRDAGDSFAEQYLDLLAAGGSDWPHRLVAPLDVDLTDTGFWDEGLRAIASLIAEAERLAGELEDAPAG